MSLPRMCALPTSSEVEKEKQRLSTAMFPALQFMGFPPVTSPGSSVFPTNLSQIPIFGQPWSYWNSVLQQQILQSLQHQSPQSRSDLSPSVSDGRTSSHAESPARKLQTDDEGNPICIVCNEKLTNEKEWAEHIEFERSNLKQNVSGLKEQKNAFDRCFNSSVLADQSRRKRETELNRIRLNQQKRLEMKHVVARDAQTPSGRPSNSASPSSSPSGNSMVKKEETPIIGNSNYCKICERHYEYLIISSSFEEPRCQSCFMKLRAQTSALPLTITSSSLDSIDSLCDESAETSSPQSPLSLVIEAKRSRFN